VPGGKWHTVMSSPVSAASAASPVFHGRVRYPLVHSEASRQAVVEAALVLPERMGLSPADLAAVPQTGADVR
jgi:hypothetical protein